MTEYVQCFGRVLNPRCSSAWIWRIAQHKDNMDIVNLINRTEWEAEKGQRN